MFKVLLYSILFTFTLTLVNCESKKTKSPTTKVRKRKKWEKDDDVKDYHVDHTDKVLKESDKREKARLKEQKKKAQTDIAQEQELVKAKEKGKKARKVNTGKFLFY